MDRRQPVYFSGLLSNSIDRLAPARNDPRRGDSDGSVPRAKSLGRGATNVKVAVVGLWHLGTVTAACLSAAGHSVLGFDESAMTVDDIARGQLPIFEPGLDSLVRQGQESGLLTFTSDPSRLGDADIVWITYDTPVDEADRGDSELAGTCLLASGVVCG